MEWTHSVPWWQALIQRDRYLLRHLRGLVSAISSVEKFNVIWIMRFKQPVVLQAFEISPLLCHAYLRIKWRKSAGKWLNHAHTFHSPATHTGSIWFARSRKARSSVIISARSSEYSWCFLTAANHSPSAVNDDTCPPRGDAANFCKTSNADSSRSKEHQRRSWCFLIKSSNECETSWSWLQKATFDCLEVSSISWIPSPITSSCCRSLWNKVVRRTFSFSKRTFFMRCFPRASWMMWWSVESAAQLCLSCVMEASWRRRSPSIWCNCWRRLSRDLLKAAN